MSMRQTARFDPGIDAAVDGARPVPAAGSAPADDIRRLLAQNERLLKSVDSLFDLHQSERAQREALQATLDRLTEELEVSGHARAPDALSDRIRQGVSEDLKPLLHAIIDLLELSARRVPTADHSDTGGSVCGGATAPDKPSPSDDLPRALPQILTKPVDELVERGGARRRGRRRNGTADGGERAGAEGSRSYAWIPVTAGRDEP